MALKLCVMLLLALWAVGNNLLVADEFDVDQLRDELLGISKRVPACLTDDQGLPKRVIISRNGTGLFTEPKAGAKRIRSLSLYARMYLYVADTGNGFHRVGVDPWGDGPTGWVPADFCLVWDHNEMLFLDGQSVPDDVSQIHLWETRELADKGDPTNAVYSENVDRERGALGDLFFPVLEKDAMGTLYKVGFLFGGDQGARDQYGQKLSASQQQEIVENISEVNLMLVMDATGSMGAYIAEAQRRATELVSTLAEGLDLKELDESQSIKLNVRFGLTAYRDRGDEFDVKLIVPLTSNQETINRQISTLTAAGGGDHPELAVEAIRHAMEKSDFDRGALNRLVLIGDAPPKKLDEELLAEVGREAKANYIQIDAMVCGSDEETQVSFRMMAEASGGTAKQIADAEELSRQILADLKKRLAIVPLEKELNEASIREGRTTTETAREMGVDAKDTRIVTKFLVARGADVASTTAVRTAWVRVRPGRAERLRVYVYMPRWKLALKLSQMLNLSDRTTLKKKAENAVALVQGILGFSAGENAGAGLDKTEMTPAERAKNVPEVTTAVKKGAAGAMAYSPQIRQKILRLLQYWNNTSDWEHDHIWIPVDALP